jgi:hypothetical protein
VTEGAIFGENQFGFAREVSCAHAYRALASVLRQAADKNEQIHLCSLDVSKAFDSIVHSQAPYSLFVNGVNTSVILF